MIKPKFWDDYKIGKISRDSRLLYIGLWTFSDDIGVVIGDTIWLKSKIFPYDQIQIQQFDKWINELVTNGFICLLSYKGERFIYLPNFTRHQVINRPNTDELNIPKELIDKEKDKIIDNSLINHGTITDLSVTKREREIEEEYKESANADKKEGETDLMQEGIKPEYAKFLIWINANTPNLKKIQRQISQEEFFKLKSKYNTQQITDILGKIDNHKDAPKKYTSVYRTFLNWAKKEYG